jgi:hypothetical protein
VVYVERRREDFGKEDDAGDPDGESLSNDDLITGECKMDCLGDWDRVVCLYVDADAASSSSITLWLRTATCSCRATFLHLSLFLALLDVDSSSALALLALSNSNFSFVCLFSSFNDEFYRDASCKKHVLKAISRRQVVHRI